MAPTGYDTIHSEIEIMQMHTEDTIVLIKSVSWQNNYLFNVD